MGLCIGFSFNDALNFVLSYLEVGVNWIKARVANKRHLLQNSETSKKVNPLDLDSKNVVSEGKCSSTSSQDMEARLKALEESFNLMRR